MPDKPMAFNAMAFENVIAMISEFTLQLSFIISQNIVAVIIKIFTTLDLGRIKNNSEGWYLWC